MANRQLPQIGPARDPRASYRQTWRARAVPAAANDNRAPLERRLRPAFRWAVVAIVVVGLMALMV